MSDLAYLSWVEAAKRIRVGELSAVDYCKAMLTRIKAHDAALNAFLQLTEETALAEARRADEAVARGDTLGPMHGVPFALKDIIDAAGLRTTAHSKILADNVATADAHVTARLKAAGAILFGQALDS